jgi:hypothetical protein
MGGKPARPLPRKSMIKEIDEVKEAKEVREETQGKTVNPERRKRCATIRNIALQTTLS